MSYAAMAKSAKHMWLRRLCLCLLGTLLLAAGGCRAAEDAPVSPSPTVAVPTPTPAPQPRNPVAAVLDAFQEAYAGQQQQLDEAIAIQPEYLGRVAEVREHMRRLQMVFQPPAGLVEGDTEAVWDGPLFGAWGGEGSITGAFGDATFKCSLEDGGRITGRLVGNAMEGTWEDYVETDIPILDEDGEVSAYEGSYQPRCVAMLWLGTQGWMARVDWQGEQSLLCIAEDTVYYRQGEVPVLRADTAPEDWAGWKFSQGIFEQLIYMVPEGEQEEDA